MIQNAVRNVLSTIFPGAVAPTCRCKGLANGENQASNGGIAFVICRFNVAEGVLQEEMAS